MPSLQQRCNLQQGKSGHSATAQKQASMTVASRRGDVGSMDTLVLAQAKAVQQRMLASLAASQREEQARFDQITPVLMMFNNTAPSHSLPVAPSLGQGAAAASVRYTRSWGPAPESSSSAGLGCFPRGIAAGNADVIPQLANLHLHSLGPPAVTGSAAPPTARSAAGTYARCKRRIKLNGKDFSVGGAGIKAVIVNLAPSQLARERWEQAKLGKM